MKIIVGGTFDRLHKGHRSIISKALEEGDVTIGLTSDTMARERKGEGVEDYNQREAALRTFAKELEIRKIEDPIGFAIEEDYRKIVVSEETKETASEINRRREIPLEIIEIDMILAQDGQPISSTRIRNGEIDREGNLI